MNMKTGNLTSENIFESVLKLAGNQLNQPDDLKLLIETALQKNKILLLEKISFQAKFSSGLLRVIQRKEGSVDDEYFLKAVEEFKLSMQTVRTDLDELFNSTSDFLKSVLDEKYLQLSQASLANLNSLCLDLSYLKLFFIDNRNAGI
jgi:hypothetical protein